MKRAKLNIGLVYSHLKGRPREEQTNTRASSSTRLEPGFDYIYSALDLDLYNCRSLASDWTPAARWRYIHTHSIPTAGKRRVNAESIYVVWCLCQGYGEAPP